MLSHYYDRNDSKKTFQTPSGTVYRVFEMNEQMEKDESGNKPIFVEPDKNKKNKVFQSDFMRK